MKNFHGQFLCLIFDYKIVGKHALSNEIFLLTGIFFFDPGHKYIYHIVLLVLSKLYALWNSMPFVQATAATAACGMLRQKYRMSTHGSLLAIVWNLGRCQPRTHKIPGVTADGIHPFLLNVLPVLLFQMKAASEIGTGQPLEQIGKAALLQVFLIFGKKLCYF